MEQIQSKDYLQNLLKGKEIQKEKFKNTLCQYTYALKIVNKEIRRITDQINAAGGTNKRIFDATEWDILLINILKNAEAPMTIEEIEAQITDDVLPDNTANKSQYVYRKILHALKRESIATYKMPGTRKAFYCLNEWLEQSVSETEKKAMVALVADCPTKE